MKINFGFRKAVTIISLAAFCIASSPVVQASGLTPMSLAQMYTLASQGNVRALRAAVQRGLNIDSTDRFGNTGLCHAIRQNNCTAYNAFRASGANSGSPCIQNIPTNEYDRFMAQSCAAAISDSPRQAYNKFNEGEFIISKRTWIFGGLLLIGGIALALSGGGGGGGGKHYIPVYTEPDDSLAKFVGTKTPDVPETSPYKRITYFADNGQSIVNRKEGTDNHDFSISNNSSIKVKNAEGTEEDKKLVDIIDLNGDILENTAYLQVAMKARGNSTVINGTASDGANVPMITLGDATAGLVADDHSIATNYGTLKTIAQNGTISMIAGNHSAATNQGEINMAFKGYNDTDSVIGMYADTYSSIVNNNNISGNTIDVSGSGTGDATANAGTIIGMEVRTVNEVTYPNAVEPSTASNNSNITLNAQSDSAAIKTSLVGMGGYLDKGFLDGTKLIRRASSLYLNNGGTITLNYTLSGSGSYAPTDDTLLNGGGGIIGIRADAKTTAINDGTINLLMASGVNNAAAGMQAVHGGTLTNNKNINITGGEGNYGMLSVRGKGSNAEIDSLLPFLLNNGSIHIISTNGFGMASYNGGTVTNSGFIKMDNIGTGMRTNTGILNNENAITLNNNGSGMVIKSGDATTDTDTSGSTEGDGGDTSGGSDDSSDSSVDSSEGSSGGSTDTTTKQDLSKAVATNNGIISINNADDAKGIFIEDGKAVNSGTGIKIVNTYGVPTKSSYGIKAEKGTVENNSLIDMNVLVSSDSGNTSVDSYGIYSDSANINNNVNGSILFRKRGTGIATTSGRVINMGKISMEQGGTGISSSSGNVYNEGTIEIVDNATAVSTGIMSQAGIITNDGSIKITGGNGATGIKAGLLVNNYKAIDLIGRNITGIELTGQDAIANNYSDINITSTGISAADKFSYGIKAGSSIVNATIKNNSNINLTGTTDLSNLEKGYGIFIADGSAYNDGNINFTNMYGWGMSTSGGTLVNNINILMDSGGYGMFGNGAEGQLTNSANAKIDITVPANDDKAETYGMFADGGTTAINKGTINITTNATPTIMLTKAYGIYVNQGNATNQGMININGSNSTGMAYGGSTDTDTIHNLAGGVINLDGENLTGMTSSGGTAINSGTINVGTNTTLSTAPNSIGMQTTGGIVINQAAININSANSVGLQSDSDAGVITNNGLISISDAAVDSYAFLSNAGAAVNGATGRVVSSLSDTDIMRATGGEILNHGVLDVKNGVNNVNAMHVTGTGSASNSSTGIINVGTSTGAGGTNNAGILVDGEGTVSNEGVINVYTQNSFGLKADNTDSTLTNKGTVNIKGGATGSVAVYSEYGDVVNDSSGIINMDVAGSAMVAKHGTITNNGKINLSQGGSDGMYVSDDGSATNTGTLDITGASSNAMRISGRGTLTNSSTGILNISGANSNAMKAETGSQATLSNAGTININAGATDAYAMYNEDGASSNETTGTINVLQSGVTAMFTKTGSLLNSGTLNLRADNVFGLSVVGNGGRATNESGATILVNNTGGKAMYVNGSSSITNNGTINLQAGGTYGLYAQNGGTATNNSDIFIEDGLSNVYAMYATNLGKIVNTRHIKLGSSGGFAMYASNSSADNQGDIEIVSNSANSSGIEAVNTSSGGTLSNSGTITVEYNGSDSTAKTNGINLNNTSSSTVTISNNGTLDIVGGLGLANGINSTGNSNITNGQNGVINVNGGAGSIGINLGGAGNVTNQGEITLANGGVGVSMNNSGTMVNGGKITVKSAKVAGSSGIKAVNTGSGGGNISNGGYIDVSYNGTTPDTKSYGINVVSDKTITINNTGSITVGTSSTDGAAYGIYAEGPVNMTNGAGANITVSGDAAVGMYLKGNGTATNNGTITVNDKAVSGASYGMYTDGGKLINGSSGVINITDAGGLAAGMYATGAGASIVNNGNIIINGVSINTSHPGSSSNTNPSPDADNPTNCTASGCGKFIQIADNATFVNNSTVSSTSALNFSLMRTDNSGSIILGRGGRFEAPEISGDITAGSSIVEEGNQREYVNENSFVGDNEGIKLNSGSYLFDAYLKKNEDGNQDVVMTMKEFGDVVNNGSVANFLSTNYDLGTNLDMYGVLKSAADAASFTAVTAEQMGLNLIPSFAKQNMDIIKAVNNHMSQTLFANQDQKEIRAMFDYVYDSRKQDGVNMLSGYEDQASTAYALFDRKLNSNFRYGIGVSFTSYDSDYDNGSRRDEVIAQVLTPLIYTSEGLKAISMPRFGIGWGEYKRRVSGLENKADTKNYYYGITNEVRKEFEVGAITLEPTAEFNILGLYQDRTKEKAGLDVKSANNLSVESGIGLYAKKTFSLRKEDDFSFRIGGSWYHEFNNPYQAARARIAGMVGSYQMDTYDVERDRGVLTIRMDYKHDEFDFFFEANKYFEEDAGYALSAGLGYKF